MRKLRLWELRSLLGGTSQLGSCLPRASPGPPESQSGALPLPLLAPLPVASLQEVSRCPFQGKVTPVLHFKNQGVPVPQLFSGSWALGGAWIQKDWCLGESCGMWWTAWRRASGRCPSPELESWPCRSPAVRRRARSPPSQGFILLICGVGTVVLTL